MLTSLRRSGIKTRRLILRLLLIAMVVEPVMFSYVMAAGHHHGGAAASMMMEHSDSMSMAEHQAFQHDSAGQHDSGQDNLANDCCSSPACGGAVMPEFIFVAGMRPSHYYTFHDVSWQGVILSSEIKPPRSL